MQTAKLLPIPALQSYFLMTAFSHLTIRPATGADCRFVWETNNDPTVRAQSIQPDPIPWEDHTRWFQQSLLRDDKLLLIAEDTEGPVGTLRFDLNVDEKTATISIALAEASRGKGYGRWLIDQGCRNILETYDVDKIIALIRPENPASIRAFSHAGFLETRRIHENDIELLRYERTNSDPS